MTFTLSKKEARRLGIEIPGPKKQPSADRMDALERDYAQYLDYQKLEGEIHDWRFEWFRFILYHGLPGEQREASYKMDFLIVKHVPYLEFFQSYQLKPGILLPAWDKLEVHEVKGYWTSRDRIRFKVAAEINPWMKFYGVQRVKGEWEYEAF